MKDIGETFHDNAVKQTEETREREQELWTQQYMNKPIEKENQEGLRIGKYGSLPQPPPTYTGFRLGEFPEFARLAAQGRQSYFMDLNWTTLPWYTRALGLLRLPYDLVKFVITGRLILIPWPWRW